MLVTMEVDSGGNNGLFFMRMRISVATCNALPCDPYARDALRITSTASFGIEVNRLATVSSSTGLRFGPRRCAPLADLLPLLGVLMGRFIGLKSYTQTSERDAFNKIGPSRLVDPERSSASISASPVFIAICILSNLPSNLTSVDSPQR